MSKAIIKEVVPSMIHPSAFTAFLRQEFGQMMAAGDYDWVHPHLTSDHFPVSSPPLQCNRVLSVSYAAGVDFEEPVFDIEHEGLDPGLIEHMWLLGAFAPNYQLSHEVVAPGSQWLFENGLFVPHLRGWKEKRFAYTRFVGLGWSPRWEFLAVEKK